MDNFCFKLTRIAFTFIIFNFIYVINQDPTEKGEPIDLKAHLQPIDVGVNPKYDTIEDDGFLCARDCNIHRKSRTCYFKLTAEQYNAMGPACGKCPEEIADCFQPQCVVADGIERTVLVFNRMLPGSAIHVCLGDEIIVNVHNVMPGRSLSVHWHGLKQQKTPWMDGTPFVTQCPFNGGQTFRYHFWAEAVGSKLYHSHEGFQMADGLVGALIVRGDEKSDPHMFLYDHDYFSHTIVIQDWLHLMTDNKYPGYNRDKERITLKADSYLINGLGSFKKPDKCWRFMKYFHVFRNFLFWTEQEPETPHATFNVQSGKRYRFRLIGGSSYTCSYRVAVQRHKMTLIAIDGHPIIPVNIRSFAMTAGDRFDVIITADQPASAYWIYVKGYKECEAATQRAILLYENSEIKFPNSLPNDDLFMELQLPDFNDLFQPCSKENNHLCMEHLQSFDKPDDILLKPKADHRFLLEASGYKFTEEELYRTSTYHRHYIPFAGPLLGGGIFTDSFGKFTCMMTPFPLLTQEDSSLQTLMCPKICPTKLCECVNIIKVDLGDVVEIVFTDETSDEFVQMHHSQHLHGNDLIILDQGDKRERDSTDLEGKNFLLSANPVKADTVTVPAFGYAVMRFHATNPGFWPIHCHLTLHNYNGMVVIFQVGERNQWKNQIPQDLPKCNNYTPPIYRAPVV